MELLIINADDWGAHEATTDAIRACFSAGTITSTTAMVFMEDSGRAASIARSERLPVGLHLNLTQPFTDPATPAAVRERQARLVRSMRRHDLRRWVYDPLIRSPVERCVADQLEAFAAAYGGPPTHVDGHNHVHLCPNVLLSRALSEVSRIRPAHAWGSRTSPPVAWARRIRAAAIARRFVVTDFFFAVRALHPRLGGHGFEAAIELADAASVEVMVHPALADERALLESDEWARALTGRRLGTYADLG